MCGLGHEIISLVGLLKVILRSLILFLLSNGYVVSDRMHVKFVGLHCRILCEVERRGEMW